MFNLMEKTLFEKYYDEWGYIEPSGKKMLINTPHQVTAAQYLKKKSLPIPKTEEGTIAKYLFETGNIRFYVDMEDEGIEVAFSIAAPVTSNQMDAIEELSKGKGKHLIFDIFDKQGDSLHFGYGLEELVSALEGMKLFKEEPAIAESLIDFPQKDMDLSVWQKNNDLYILKPEVKDKIFDVIKSYKSVDLLDIADEIRIVGSIGTNLYTEDADIDVHIVPKNVDEWTEEKQKEVKVWFDEHAEELNAFVDGHRIEIFVQLQSHIDHLSDAVYDVQTDEWKKGPRIVPMNYDPYEDFSNIGDDIKNAVQGTDIVIGELKRDIIDYETVHSVLPRLPKEAQEKLRLRLKSKLADIEKDIESLHLKRKNWVELRRFGNKAIKSWEDLKNTKLVDDWRDMNAAFKFIARYQYMTIIKELEEFLKDDGEITHDEMDQIKSVMGIRDV
jgi:hypothetical protein